MPAADFWALLSSQVVLVGGAATALVKKIEKSKLPEEIMADLTALKQAATDLSNLVPVVESAVQALKLGAVPQSEVDAVTATVQQATAQIQTAVQ